MRLFIANNVLAEWTSSMTDWTYGMMVVAAESEDDIRDIVIDGGFDWDRDIAQGTWTDHGFVDGDARVIAYCWGGS